MSIGEGLLFLLLSFVVAPAIIAVFLWVGDRLRDWWFGRKLVDIEIPARVLSVPKDLVADGTFAARLTKMMNEPDSGDGEAH